MEVEAFINPEVVKIGDREFKLSSIPAVTAQAIYGDIVRSTEEVGDIGMTFLPLNVTKKMLAYAAYQEDGVWYTLEEEHRINQVCPDAITLIRLEAEMIRKNFGFLFNGSLQGVLEALKRGHEVT